MDLITFNRLTATYQEMAYDIACHLLGDREGAAAVVETGIAALCRASDDLDVDRFRCRLLANVVRGCVERTGVRRPAASGLYSTFNWDEGLASTGTVLTQLLPLNDAIKTGLLALAVEERIVLLLHDRYDCSDLETATVIGLSLGVVRRRLLQARLGLRNYLVEHSNFPPIEVHSRS